MTKPVKTTCPYCGVGCGVIATPQPDGSVDIKGDPDHPANFGRLCSKGSALGETMDLEDRILYPKIGENTVSWDDALDMVAAGFRETIDNYGPDSVAFYVSGQILTEDYYVANKLMKGYIGSANIDTNSRLCMASSVAGHKRAFGSDTVPGLYEDLELTDLLILVGSNLAWCHPVLYQRVAAAKQERPEMKVVLIDPRRTMTADIADMHLAINPDSDCHLFMGLLAALNDAGTINQNYIDKHTNGFEAALEEACKLTSEEILKATGLGQATLNEFYDLVIRTEKTVTLYSQGVNQSTSGTDKVNAIINCHLATGRIGRPGMGPFSATGQPNAMGGREVGGLANMLASHMDIENPQHRDLVQGFWRSPTIAEKPGLKAVDLFKAVGDGKIKALWIMATNPVDSLPDGDAIEAAIKACPFVVVSDILAETDTVRHADIVLPSAGWGEKDGTVTNSERAISRQRGFLPFPGEARADWWQMAEVAKRMGFDDAFTYAGPADIFREYATLTTLSNDGVRDLNLAALADLDATEFDALETVYWPARDHASSKGKRFFADGGFFTPDKRARFLPVKAPIEIERASTEQLTLNTGRVRDHWHTMTRTAKTARLSGHLAEPYCEIHPDDAEARDIQPADLVTITAATAMITVRALLSSRQKPGNIFVPIHWTDQFASSGRVDRLIPPLTDPFSGQPASKNVPVAVKRAALHWHGFAVTRDLPTNIAADYWAKAKCDGGWRLELGFATSEANLATAAAMACGEDLENVSIQYRDKATGQQTLLWFHGDRLTAAVFLARRPVSVSRIWAVDQLTASHFDLTARSKLAAGRAGLDQPDRGPIVCSCFSVGANEIRLAAQSGNRTLAAIGKAVSAGTNCGSCRSEISAILEEDMPLAAE